MVWCDAKAHQAKGDRQGLVHVDFDVLDLGHGAVGGVEPGRTGADDGQTEGGAIAGWESVCGGGGCAQGLCCRETSRCG